MKERQGSKAPSSPLNFGFTSKYLRDAVLKAKKRNAGHPIEYTISVMHAKTISLT